MAQWCRKYKVAIWVWCLMPNHVHLIAIPQDETDFARAVGEALRCYTRRINFREQWRGHLWQEWFASFPMNEQHLPAAARHIDFLKLSTEDELKVLQLHERTGRPLGSQALFFAANLTFDIFSQKSYNIRIDT